MVALNEIVTTTVVIKFDATGDISYGHDGGYYTGPSNTFWIDLAASSVMPHEFGGFIEYYARVTNLALTRNSVTRIAVALVAFKEWSSRPVPVKIEIASTGGTANRCYLLDGSGNRITTYASIYEQTAETIFRVNGVNAALVGWTQRVPDPLVWNKSALALAKRVPATYIDPVNGYTEHVSGVSNFSNTIASLNTWLATNKPDYGTGLVVYFTVFSEYTGEVSGNITLNNRRIERYKLKLHAYNGNNYSYSLQCLGSNEYTGVVSTAFGGPSACAIVPIGYGHGNTIQNTGPTVVLAVGDLAGYAYVSGTSGTHAPASTLTGSARYGYSISDIICGLDWTITVDSEGRLTNIALTPILRVSYSLTSSEGFGIILNEGGANQ